MKAMLVASLTSAIAALACMAGLATAQSPGADSVAGVASDCVESIEPVPGQILCLRRLNIDVEVQSGPAGESPSGTVILDEQGTTPGGSTHTETDATCLSVSNGVAIVGVAGTHQRFGATGFVVPVAGLVRVVDAGGPNSGADTFQVAVEFGSEFGPPLPGPTSCSAFPGPFQTGLLPVFTNEAGDIVVTDTQPFPTTKDQCKNGGWRSYNVFKNQGACVSFVATGGKNPPGKS